MASKSAQQEPEKAEVIEELLDLLDTTLDRVKVLYEQYFLGIQKQPPAHLHLDVERKLRDLSQMQIRNTALRYRLATLQQKFGSYNSYWRRTLRQIENGTYLRSLSKVGRHAAKSGDAIPEEILAAMPKLMREQVKRDRENALAMAQRRHKSDAGIPDASDGIPIFEDEDGTQPFLPDEAVAVIAEPTELRRTLRQNNNAHVVDPDDADLDLDAFFAQIEQDSEPALVADVPPVHHDSVVRFRPPSIPMPAMRPLPPPPGAAPSQVSRPNPIAPGSSVARGAVPVESVGWSAPRPKSDTDSPGIVHSAPPRDDSIPPRPLPRVATSPGIPARAPTGVLPRIPTSPAGPPRVPTGVLPRIPTSPAAPPRAPTGAVPRIATQPGVQPAPPSSSQPVAQYPGPQHVRPVAQYPEPPTPQAPPRPRAAPPVAASSRPTADGPRAVPPDVRSRPVPRAAASRPEQPPPQTPPPGMTDADVNALYATYVRAKEMVGEKTGPGSYSKLLKTINAQAPKIMEQYKAKAVDFSVVVKDNQVIIRAKPKT